MNRLMVMTNMNVDGMRVHNETWAQQLKDAMNVNGGDVENASAGDYVMHFLTFGFKIVFALVPPPGLLGGWLCFFFSLVMIAVLTAIVGDLAGIFGCLVGLKDSVTAITFVALGTSLPDTFASKAAAVGEKYADNAIGNITGSNSVNVFLGLGLPWLIAAIYHEANVSQSSTSAYIALHMVVHTTNLMPYPFPPSFRPSFGFSNVTYRATIFASSLALSASPSCCIRCWPWPAFPSSCSVGRPSSAGRRNWAGRRAPQSSPP